MTETHTRLLAEIFACIFFGYSIVNSLIFFQRGRRPENYSSKKIGDFVRSPRYGQTVWLSGVVGVIGFAVASWMLVATVLQMLHGG
ncbi:MAG TPA: hypothetical protein VKS22_02390 [Candidatus Binataceae bacterium]|nr:hypothetical protein [Candidatus Binataceae bacterium]